MIGNQLKTILEQSKEGREGGKEERKRKEL
jgi:hypothetical protein